MIQRKAQGMPLNTIVIAVLVLLILVILVIIFGKYTNIFTKGVKGCANVGGIDCYADCEAETVQKPTGSILANIPGTECEDRTDGKIKCCKVVYEAQTPP